MRIEAKQVAPAVSDTQLRAADASGAEFGPWNPGIVSQLPVELRHLCTVFRAENVSTSLSAATELQSLTGLPATELVAFRPQRLVLHEVLIRVTAELSVPDGSRIEDLGINFRKITSRLIRGYLEPQMPAITAAFVQTRRSLAGAIHSAFADVVDAAPAQVSAGRSPLLRLWSRRRSAPPPAAEPAGWGLAQIAACEHQASTTGDALQGAACRSLAHVLSALFATHGGAWGTRELIESLATDIACNTYGSTALGELVDPLLREAARREGFNLLPQQQHPVVINTKGPSASGKSTLSPLQTAPRSQHRRKLERLCTHQSRHLAQATARLRGARAEYRYAGAFTSEELQIIDHKLDGYMARKRAQGAMSHLMIDRFRFDSFAPNSDEAGSNLLTRFGHTVYLFFMITPPELLVERAWKRGLEVGRYKAVDDTLAHSVEAYAGMSDVFFTWVQRTDKSIHFEFLDNSVQFGELPRVMAFGNNHTFNLLDLNGLLDIERFKRVDVEARTPAALYADRGLLAPEHNVGFLKRCIERFREVNFASQATGRIYLRIEAGVPLWVDRAALEEALVDPGTRAALLAVAPDAFDSTVPAAAEPLYLGALVQGGATLGQWGSAH